MARSKSDQAFDERIAKNSEELRELLTDLYGEQAEEAFQNLTELMKASHAARPADLKRLDTKRLADPEWYKRGNMFGMTMYTDLFAGDLKKLAGKVPYLKEQKLTYLHLMPTAENAASAERRRLCGGRFRHRRSGRSVRMKTSRRSPKNCVRPASVCASTS